jgi:GTP-binding protein
MFVDELEIHVRAGKGGNGCVCFLRDAKTLRGGPNGGDGGDGGDVVLLPTTHCNTLYHLTGRGTFEAPTTVGRACRSTAAARTPRTCSSRCRSAPSCSMPSAATCCTTLDRPDRPWVLARGGYGGRGNTHFATATHRTPREAERGKPGEERRVLLSLKLIADVGCWACPTPASRRCWRRSRGRGRRSPAIRSPRSSRCWASPRVAGDSTFVLADIPGSDRGRECRARGSATAS